jgi:hypothetical protein
MFSTLDVLEVDVLVVDVLELDVFGARRFGNGALSIQLSFLYLNKK